MCHTSTPDFKWVGKSDARLSEQYDTARGCGGVAVLWHRDLDATPIGDIGSDRMCGIRFQADEGTNSVLSLIGLYKPCLNLGME